MARTDGTTHMERRTFLKMIGAVVAMISAGQFTQWFSRKPLPPEGSVRYTKARHYTKLAG